jgi:tRNA threonylcarbamoyl adenosine modification protein YjeE
VTLPARVEVRAVGPEAAAQVRAVVLPAFRARPVLDPPAAALDESEEMLATLLSHHGGLVASLEGRDVGALVLDPVGSTMYLRRFGVDRAYQGHGVARALIDAAVEAADGYEDLTVVAREELPNTIQFWERQGFREILRDPPNVELRRPLRTFIFDVPDADAMRELGAGLAAELAAGDLVVLSGELGAGKTTFTQGLGSGLGVRGDVTSPTFVIARVHPSLGDGPDLVHVDAYRLGGIDELDDLDLDTSLDEAVTVVEWGEGVAEGLAESRLEIRIIRALAHDDEHDGLDPRRVLLTPVGPRWHALDVPATQRPPLAKKLSETLLLDFRPCAEDELGDLDPVTPLRLSLVTARHGAQVLVVRNLRTGEWELPGGPIADGETPRRTAERRLVEETGVRPGTVAFVGIATVQIGPARDLVRVALFRTALHDRTTAAGAGGRELTWWAPGSELAGLSPIDAHLAELSVADRPSAGA